MGEGTLRQAFSTELYFLKQPPVPKLFFSDGAPLDQNILEDLLLLDSVLSPQLVSNIAMRVILVIYM